MSELARLRWLCRRGMKELDVLLTRYLECVYPSADPTYRAVFEDLLALSDPELYALLMGKISSLDKDRVHVIEQIRRTSGPQN